MKVPKVKKSSKEEKNSELKHGKVKKTAGTAVPKKKLGGLASRNTADHILNLINPKVDNVGLSSGKTSDKVLNFLKFSEDNINLKVKKAKSNAPTATNVDKSPKTKSAKNVAKSPKTKNSNRSPDIKGEKTKNVKHLLTSVSDRSLEMSGPTLNKNKTKKNIQNDMENNTSPIKTTKENKKVKIPLQLDSTLSTPLKEDGSNQSKGDKSPEVILGLELEKALSPKSKKEKKKLKLKQKLVTEGKIEVTKKAVKKSEEASIKNSEEASVVGKKKRRRRRRSKKQLTPALPEPSLFEIVNATNALKALLKTSKASKSEKKELFGEDKFIYLQCNLLKGTDMSKSVLHITLPHLILPQPYEVCLITPDLKGKRNDPDEAIDFYKELLKKNNIDYISEIIPIRKLKKEYTSFEHRRNLANRFDAILADGRVSKLARIGRRFAPTKKCISTVNFDVVNLKQEFDKSLRKIAMFCQGRGLSLSIKCGREGMSVNDIVENIMEIGKQLANDKIIIGNIKNISSVYVKTALSQSFPIYISTYSPNEVPVPEGKKRKVEEAVEDDVTTVLGGTVVVHPSGNVKVKKQKLENLDSDDELHQHKKKSLVKNNKTPVVSNKEDSESDSDFDLGSDISEEMYSDASEGEEGIDSEDNIDTSGKDVEETDDAGSDESGSESDDFEEETAAAEGTESDDNTDNSGMEDETDNAESNESESESDEFEEKIAAAEREYLQEVRHLQDGIAKKKKAFKGKVSEEKTKMGDKIVPHHAKKSETHASQKSGNNLQKKIKKGSNKQVSSKEINSKAKQANQKKLESNLENNKKLEKNQTDQIKQQKESKKLKSVAQEQGKQKMSYFEKVNQKEGNKFINGISHDNKKGNEKLTIKGSKSVKENKFDNEINLTKPGKSQQKGKKQGQPLKAVNQQLSEPSLNKKHQQKKGKTEAEGGSKFSVKKPFMGGKKFKSK